MTTSDISSELEEKLKVLLFDFAKYVRLASMQANKNISAYYQLDNKANVDVEALINDTVAHIQLLTRDRIKSLQEDREES